MAWAAYFPWNRGFRFSANAASASRRSSLTERLVVAHLLELEAQLERRVEGAVDGLERRRLRDGRPLGDRLDPLDGVIDQACRAPASRG